MENLPDHLVVTVLYATLSILNKVILKSGIPSLAVDPFGLSILEFSILMIYTPRFMSRDFFE